MALRREALEDLALAAELSRSARRSGATVRKAV
jgi:hypothetical protein